MDKSQEYEKHLKQFKWDLDEGSSVRRVSKNILSKAYHFIKDPLANIFLRNFLSRHGGVPKSIDIFQLNDGGLYQTRAYEICDSLKKIRGAKVLVLGCGYGRSIIQLARFKPREIVAFDIFGCSSEWNYLTKLVNSWGVKIKFFKRTLKELEKDYIDYFDYIVSDAVFEHIEDLDGFMKSPFKMLRKGGMFYASFGPLWFGPSGDRVIWGEEKLYDHLLLSEKDYKKSLKKRKDSMDRDEFENINETLFSRLSIKEYLEILDKNHFKNRKIIIQISSKAMKLLSKRKDLEVKLDHTKVPKLDRYCKGAYFWLQK